MKKLFYIFATAFLCLGAAFASAQTTLKHQPALQYLGNISVAAELNSDGTNKLECRLSTPTYYWSVRDAIFKRCAGTNVWKEFGATGGTILGSYAKSALPTTADVKAGARARVTDSTRGVWHYNGSTWVPEDTGRRVNLLDYCDPTTTSDCTSGINNAVAALVRIGGGRIVAPAGYSFGFAGQIKLNGKAAIGFESSGSMSELSKPNLIYTGAGEYAAFDARSSHGIGFHNIHIRYTNPNFTGYLIQFGHDPAFGGRDAVYMTFENVTLAGHGARNAAGLIDFNNSILGNVSKTHFLSAKTAVRGVVPLQNLTINSSAVSTAADTITLPGHKFLSTDQILFKNNPPLPAPLQQNVYYYAIRIDTNTIKLASSYDNAVNGTAINLTTAGGNGTNLLNDGYSYVIQIENNCSFNYFTTAAIFNPDSSWTITGNNFSPSDATTSSYTNAIDSDGTHFIRALTVQNNYIGDARTQPTPSFRIKRPLGFTFKDNWGTVGYNGILLEVSGGQAVDISTNRIETGEAPSGQIAATTGIFINGSSEPNLGVSIKNNSLNATTPITESGNNKGIERINNTASGGMLPNSMTNALEITGSPGSDPVGAGVNSIGFGQILSNVSNGTAGRLGGGIRMSGDGVGGYAAGSMFFTTRSDTLYAPFAFYPSGVRRFEIGTNIVNYTLQIPATNNTLDLGSTDNKFRNGYFGNSLYGANGLFGNSLIVGSQNTPNGRLDVTAPSGSVTANLYTALGIAGQSTLRIATNSIASPDVDLRLGASNSGGFGTNSTILGTFTNHNLGFVTNGTSRGGFSATGNFSVTTGDVYVSDQTKGIILKAPDGTCYRFTVANGGALSAGAALTCP